ncbi:hypothetical protein QQS21_000327 [Conoideocrella luteorostrata]|uniref:BTB domain-containing protein n=1 Tax=Conoideocrella luteorostrata TaxID=1105319 RepID=A0AAJ0FZB1_9HYPO|nr:hypothetical protein QQS21_000327 [Conoideocrella luteorostrata]
MPGSPEYFESFVSSLQKQFNTDSLSDVVIVCANETMKAHRVILATHSSYFEKALSGNWVESSSNRIEIKDFDPRVIEAMLRFMYSFDYNNDSGISSMIYDAQVYQAADKYDVPGLKKLAQKKFKSAISTGWSSDDFPEAINVAYDSTPPADKGLRDLIIATSCKHINELLKNELFRGLLRETPDFAADLIPSLCENPSLWAQQRYKCPPCGYTISVDFFDGIPHCPYCSSKCVKDSP